jgi:threonine dehydratase
LSEEKANIIDVDHHRHFYDLPAKRAALSVSFESRNQEHVTTIIKKLHDIGFDCVIKKMQNT